MAYVEKEDIDFHEAEFERMLAAISPIRAGGFKRALDIGGGGGMHSAFLTRISERVFCSDFSDQNANYRGEFVKLLDEKFERNGSPFDAKKFEFHAGDAMDMFYRDGAFDLVVSFNAFEHIPDPVAAAREVVRVLAPGGVAYLTFDPLWACDSGSHFLHRVPRPWEHLLCSEESYVLAMAEGGAAADEIEDFRHAMNKVPLQTYRSIFKSGCAGTQLIGYDEWQGVTNEAYRSHENYDRARSLGYSDDDLMVRGISVVLTRDDANISDSREFAFPIIPSD